MVTIKNIGVLGAGQMGREIALNGAVSGYNVCLYDNVPQSLTAAQEWAAGYLNKSVEKKVMTREQCQESLARITYSNDLEKSVALAELLIESVVEKEEVKRELFQALRPYVASHCIITTNSSYIPSSRFVQDVDFPQNLANLHYFNPAMRMKIVEIARNPHTSDETIDTLVNFVKSIGKESILVQKEIEGFVVNRLLRALQNESFYLLENGIASFEDIDLAAEKGLNHPMGPFRLMDFTGLDTSYFSRRATYEKTQQPEDEPPPSLKERVDAKQYGRKTGQGWYEYK